MVYFQHSNSGNYQKFMRVDEVMDVFLFEYKYFGKNPESTADVTSFGIVSIMRAIINLQKN